MITQEQLEKIIKEYIGNVPIKGNLDGTQCLYINEGAIIKLASAILSAMRIDEEVLKVIIDKELASNVTWRHIDFPDDFDYDRIMTRIFYDISKAIASHTQEIIRFEEDSE